MKTMVSTRVGNVIVLLHTNAPPRDDEWAKYLAEVKAEPEISRLRCIAFTDGGAPTVKQRRGLNELLDGRRLRSLVISRNPLIRGAVAALNMVNPLTRAFSPDALDEAFAYLRLTGEEIAAAHQALDALHAELGFRLKCSPPEPRSPRGPL